MISDEELRQFTGNEWLHSGDADFGAEIIDMATELLQLREEKRKAEEARAKSWEDAPEWANWYAQDKDGGSWYYENKPIREATIWSSFKGKYESTPNCRWEDSLQERQK